MITLIFAALILALLGVSAAMLLAFMQNLSLALKQWAIDAIEIYARATQAKLDTETRRARLDVWQDYAQQTLHERRQKLIGGGEK
jgi:hypothetical protein